jgi:hypothetical protein
MKTITKITALVAVLLMLAGGLTSCKDKEPFLEIEETSISVLVEGGTYSIQVSSNGAWTAFVEDSENETWLNLIDASRTSVPYIVGMKNETITVKIATNPHNTPRSATVTIVFKSLIKSVVFNQDYTNIEYDEQLMQLKMSTENRCVFALDDIYNYPVRPGMEEWGNLKTGEEMLEACQIPRDTLDKMSSQAIVQAILDHPLAYDVLHRRQYQMDFESTFFQNNAYFELTKRKDAGEAILERLFCVNLLSTSFGEMRKVLGLEVLMSQTVFLSRLNTKEAKRVVMIALIHDKIRQEQKLFFREDLTAFFLIAKTLYRQDYSPFVVETFRDPELWRLVESRNYTFMPWRDGYIVQLILKHANNYLENKLII